MDVEHEHVTLIVPAHESFTTSIEGRVQEANITWLWQCIRCTVYYGQYQTRK